MRLAVSANPANRFTWPRKEGKLNQLLQNEGHKNSILGTAGIKLESLWLIRRDLINKRLPGSLQLLVLILQNYKNTFHLRAAEEKQNGFPFRFGFKMSQIKLLFGPLIIQLAWYILYYSVSESGGYLPRRFYSLPLRWVTVRALYEELITL